MQIKWYGHACFRLQAGEVSVITDPFTPETSGLHPVTDTATFVIRSSNDDDFHCNAEMIPGHPKILDAVALAADGGYVADGLRVTAFDTMESVNKEDPRANAMYRLELGDLKGLDLGDLGNPFSDSQLRELAGEVDATSPGGRPADDRAGRPRERDRSDRPAGRHPDALPHTSDPRQLPASYGLPGAIRPRVDPNHREHRDRALQSRSACGAKDYRLGPELLMGSAERADNAALASVLMAPGELSSRSSQYRVHCREGP